MTAAVTSLLLTAGTLLAAAPLRSEAPADTAHLYESREEIVVTGFRTAVTKDLLPLSVSVLPASVLRSGSSASALPAVASRVPGVFLTERGVVGFGVARGAAGTLSIRGLSVTRVAILLDGRPYAMGLFGHPLGDFHMAPEAERAEVVRGPASVLYGSGAMGGVVNLLSPGVAARGVAGTADLSYGSWNTGHAALGLTYGSEDLRARAGFVRDRTDGHRDRLDFGSTLGSAALDVRLADGLRLHGTGSFQRSQAFDPGPVTLPRPYENNRMDLDRGAAALRLANTWKAAQGAMEVSFGWGDHDLEYNGFHSDDYTFAVSLYQSALPIANGVITGGVDFREQGGSASEGTTALGEHVLRSTGIYALARQEIVPGFHGTAGLRAETGSPFGTELVPHAGLTAAVGSGVRLRGSVSKGYRNPTINELYFQYLGKRPNPDLEPERLWNYELGVAADLAEGSASLEVTVFQAEGSNLIENRPILPPPITPGPSVRPVNVGGLKNRGVEVEGRVRLLEELNLSLAGTYLVGRPDLLAVPRLQLGGEVRYQAGVFTGRLSVHHVAHLLTQIAPREVVQTYTLAGLRAGYDVLPGVELHATVNNVLDEAYEINAGYPMPGRHVMAGVRAALP